MPQKGLMMTESKYLLQLFAGGEGGGEAGGAGAAGAEATTGGTDGLAHRDGGEAPAEAPRDFEEEWKALKKGDYKEQYDRDVKAAVDKRFKSAKAAEDNLAKMQPLMQALATKYGKDVSDIDGILQASNDDDSYYEQAAYDAGLSVSEYRQQEAQRRELAELREAKAQIEREKEWNSRVTVWAQQAEAAKASFPGIDLREEMNHPETGKQFLGMLMSGVPVQTAYQAIHFNDLVTQSSTIAAQQAQQATVNSIRANGMRPVENGLNAQTPVSQKVDINGLTDKQVNDLLERAARGEKITLKNGF